MIQDPDRQWPKKKKKNRNTSTITVKCTNWHILNDSLVTEGRGKKKAYEVNPSPGNSPGRLVKINCTALIFLAASMYSLKLSRAPWPNPKSRSIVNSAHLLPKLVFSTIQTVTSAAELSHSRHFCGESIKPTCSSLSAATGGHAPFPLAE